MRASRSKLPSIGSRAITTITAVPAGSWIMLNSSPALTSSTTQKPSSSAGAIGTRTTMAFADRHADVWAAAYQQQPRAFSRERRRTILNSNYRRQFRRPPHQSKFHCPSVSPDSILALRFWQYYQYGAGDAGLVQIAPVSSPQFGTTLTVAATNGTSGNWTPLAVDLTPYQGQQVRVGFYHSAKQRQFRRRGLVSGRREPLLICAQSIDTRRAFDQRVFRQRPIPILRPPGPARRTFNW